ncbi:hypothetical protein BVY03_01795 [bacterium K02(2017)]|nr:hypothetical protein BVY03_01795 [bacterium K02(2017)]
MKAFILAAGFGTRMQPLTLTTPKPMVKVNQIPLIFYNLALLKHHKIKNVVINLHHLGHLIRKQLGNGKHLGLNITYSNEPKILGTGGGIKKAMRYFKQDMLIINSDIIADFNLSQLIKLHKKKNTLATLALYNHPQKKKYGLLYSNGSKLTSILGQPKASLQDKSAMFGSYHVLNKKMVTPLFKAQKNNKKFCIMRDIYMPHLLEHDVFNAYQLKGYWRVCDSMQDVKQTEKDLTKNKVKLSYQKELNYIVSRVS